MKKNVLFQGTLALLLAAGASGTPVLAAGEQEEIDITPQLESIDLESIETVNWKENGKIEFSLEPVEGVEVEGCLQVIPDHPEVFTMDGAGNWQAVAPGSTNVYVDVKYTEEDMKKLEAAFPGKKLVVRDIALDVKQYVYVTAPTDTVFRLYNPNSGEHFFTSDEKEKDYLVKIGWKEETSHWLAPEESPYAIYRLYNPNAGDHHYTTDVQEKERLVKLGWNDEGIAFYSAAGSSTPLYRVYNPNAKSGAHHFTTSHDEYEALNRFGWKQEDIAWYSMEEIPL